MKLEHAPVPALRPSEYTAALIQVLQANKEFIKGARVLDVGSGSGIVLAAMAEIKDEDNLPSLEAIERKLENLKQDRERLGAVNLRADDELQSEIDDLRQKANNGTLAPEEEAAYRDFVDALDVISILQSKARRFLKQHTG